jgi:hypothetical protein
MLKFVTHASSLKKLLVFLLLSVFLYNQAGYFIAFKMEQQEARREIKRRIKNSVPQNELTIIRISSQNVHKMQWVKEGREFMYANGLYDVVRVEAEGNEMVYHCINDIQEKQLFTDLDEHVRKHMDDSSGERKSPHKSIAKDYFVEDHAVPLFISYEIIHFLPAPEATIERLAMSLSPPPERA